MQLTTHIKRLIYPLYIYPKITAEKRKKLHALFSSFKQNQQQDITLRLFSNMEEDGIILRLLASIKTEKGCFLDIGSNDCINSNCANLAFNFDWKGVFIDANEHLLSIGKRNYTFFGRHHGLKFVPGMLYPENINQVVNANIPTREIDFMSVDIDGNDYAIWQALTCVKPKIVVIENKIEYGRHEIVVPVKDPFTPAQWGASIVSITRLAEEKGYTLVATNKEGFNAFYMRNDCMSLSGTRALPLEKILEEESVSKCFYGEEIMQPLIKSLG